MSRYETRLLLACITAMAAQAAGAQYKITEPGGRVTYADRPPSAASANVRVQPIGLAGAAATPFDALPLELQQPVRRFPVTLYTMSGCSACDNARFYLRRRGIPYSEKTVSSPADREAFAALNVGTEVPVLRIGQQTLRNFSEAAWAADLDLAGYPATSKLPPVYNGWEPTPLVAAAPPPPPRSPATSVAPPPAPSPAASGGIRF